MIYFDEQSSVNIKLEEQLKTSLSNLVQRGCDTLGVFQGLLVQIEDEAVDVIIKASSAYPPNFKTLPSFASCIPVENSFPVNSIKASSGFKQWFSTYFNAEKYIRGRVHNFDGHHMFLVFINACPELPINLEKVALLDDCLAVTLEKFQLEKGESHQNTLYEKLQSVASIGTWEVDLRNNALSWSSQTRRIHEVSDDFKPTMEDAISFYKEGFNRNEINRIVSHTIETGEPWCATLELVSAKGNPVWIETHGMAEFKNGKCIRLFGTCQNVNKSVQLRLELDARRKEAEAASKERGLLLSRISHELKTPLNGITGMLQAIRFEKKDNVRIKKADIALHSADRLLSLINDVLDYTSIINGEFSLSYSDFCVRSLAEDIVDVFKGRCAEKGIRLYAVLSFDDKTYVNGDAARISQVLTNLLSNAVKFTSKGYISVQVTLKQQSNIPVLLASVEDSGVGMNDDILSRIFRPFQNDRASASEELNGNGLGLSIVNQLIDKMGGELEVRSKVGIGTCFDIAIPVEMASLEKEVKNDVELSSELLNIPLNILVVDDNDINRLVLASMLERFNYVPDEADNGEVAVEMARAKRYDLIFMDCAMPVLDGMSAAKIIKQEGLLSEHGRIVAVTANTTAEDKISCSEAGMADFLSKPVVQNDVTMQVRTTLNAKSITA
ncbi:response regulator [Alteromonas sp. IB21]|uniref:ATP-binding protein n=1 Tax=Alteromonas sp. IB21 TaxID=2779369 RepID=UPI0018E846E3|nr:ATP-binding protein [Alteromonas sp. IB21]MBJ2128779.1 response regulator [Alteromonas sp. IB21]